MGAGAAEFLRKGRGRAARSDDKGGGILSSGAASGPAALALALYGHRTGIYDGNIRLVGRNFLKPLAGQGFTQLLAFILIYLAAEGYYRKVIHILKGAKHKKD